MTLASTICARWVSKTLVNTRQISLAGLLAGLFMFGLTRTNNRLFVKLEGLGLLAILCNPMSSSCCFNCKMVGHLSRIAVFETYIKRYSHKVADTSSLTFIV